ncbi:MAG TPA: DUF4147 domain-containing protein [Candidatus Binataceae bacterium]|nr:DUF4147 domain-containing protein [Candidatus Binataceae bacterium]
MDAHIARRDLEQIFRAAIDAVEPCRLTTRALLGESAASAEVPAMVDASRRIFVIAVGKAAAAMMRGVESVCGGKIAESVVIVPDAGAGAETLATGRHQAIFRSGHPIPNAVSEQAARAALALAGKASAEDLLIVAVSGGASALMALPDGAVTLEDKIATTRLLLASGASIGELNTVRRHLSAIKGGRLLRAASGARVLGLMLSDVKGNDLSTIGSGPTAADDSTYADARAVLMRYRVWERVSTAVRERLEQGVAGRVRETVKAGDPELAGVMNLIVGDNAAALAGARKAAAMLGYKIDLWRELYGEAREVGRALAAHLCAIKDRRTCVLAGGEPVVAVSGDGRGGREQELALALAIELDRIGRGRNIAVLAAGSDGIDGPTDAAGAFAYAASVARAKSTGIDPEEALMQNDSYRVFEAIGDLYRPGPTGTNVADIVIALVD